MKRGNIVRYMPVLSEKEVAIIVYACKNLYPNKNLDIHHGNVFFLDRSSVLACVSDLYFQSNKRAIVSNILSKLKASPPFENFTRLEMQLSRIKTIKFFGRLPNSITLRRVVKDHLIPVDEHTTLSLYRITNHSENLSCVRYKFTIDTRIVSQVNDLLMKHCL